MYTTAYRACCSKQVGKPKIWKGRQTHNCSKHAGKLKMKGMNNTRTYSILQKYVVRKCSVCAQMAGFDVTVTESSANTIRRSWVIGVLCFSLLPSTRSVFRNFSRFTAPKQDPGQLSYCSDSVTGWRTEESCFDSWLKQDIYLFSKASLQAVRPTNEPNRKRGPILPA